MISQKQLSIKSASRIYDIPEWTLRAYIRDNLCPTRRLGRKVYIPVEKFEAWLEQRDIESSAQKDKTAKKIEERIEKSRTTESERGGEI